MNTWCSSWTQTFDSGISIFSSISKDVRGETSPPLPVLERASSVAVVVELLSLNFTRFEEILKLVIPAE